MTQFRVTNTADRRIEDAVAICPVNAFKGEVGNRSIDDEACIRCGACTEIAPNAVVREARADISQSII